ncbi:DUF3310 domain-containing protein [Rhodococcus erythropolis]|uniref:DUF3310 domain-containing protein n=1 Tax=Rhodococcus erythropolis TaxID=1833 RepID=UPI0024B99F82|nr:DUF3310 domain-containing protein [Rhodococcus erythropolis]MDJ0405859.1 DUF3310 domain-containing protein [Rhodococcus erythropolis]
MTDPVNHPAHYTTHPSGIECIQITEHMGFNLGNAVKYIWRADLKGSAIEDLEKARWYIDRELAKRDALFPATEPAEAATNSMLKVPASDEVSGNNVAECNSSTGGEDVQAKKITRAWMLHLGYSEDHVDSLEQATHEGYGCEHNPLGSWDCIDESGDSQHQDWDEYDNTAQIVMFVLERVAADHLTDRRL